MTMDEKWIGLALAISGSMAIGMSAIIMKKGLNASSNRTYDGESASDKLAYLRNPIWWAGMSTQILGEIANFAAYTFAPPLLVTPLGALSVLVGAIAASFLLNEVLGHLGRVGCTLSLIGSLIIVLHAPEDTPVETVDELLEFAAQPGFLLYVLAVVVFTVVMVYTAVPRYGRSNPLVYISICSVVGSISVMAIKAFGVAVRLTFEGKNQFVRPSTYVFGVVATFGILVQMNYYNKALDTFFVNIVNTMYYVGFSTATIVASLILFQGFNTTDATNTISLLCGFIVTFLGVYILNLSRASVDHSENRIPGEGGLANSSLNLLDRMSLDGWHDQNASRRNLLSRPRTQNTTLFDADQTAEHIPLRQVVEDEECELEEEVDDRPRLHAERSSRTRSLDSTPRQSQVDVRPLSRQV